MAKRRETPMTDLRTVTRFLYIGLCTVALTACGDSGDDGTATAPTNPTNEETGNTDSNSSDPSSDPSTSNNTNPTEDGGTVGMTGNSEPTLTGETGNETGIDATATGTGETGADTESQTTEPTPECGDGVVNGTEECDDGNQDNGDGCESNCTNTAVCGDGVVQVGEVCDDGNTNDDDQCSGDCQTATPDQVCGNGTVEDPEVCDDGNNVDGDGCEADCTPSAAVCGNGIIEGNEACDDGNDVDGGPGDFCKNDCTAFVPPNCSAPSEYLICDEGLNLMDKNDKTNAHKAMGICNDQDNNSVKISNYTFTAATGASWQVAKGFGTFAFDDDNDNQTPDKLLYSPREGESFLMISTGRIAAPNGQGIVTEANASQEGNGDNGNADNPNAMPAPLSDDVGSNNGAGGTPFMQCDGVNDCSDTLYHQWNEVAMGDPNDQLFFKFNMTVPAGTFGYTFDFVFCSSEWPDWVDSSFNDMFIVWQKDPTPDDPNADPPVDPYTGNVTFIPDPNDPTQGLPLTITALDGYYQGDGFSGNEPQLGGTGFQTNACSNWFKAKGGVQPGADVEIGFYLADMGDSILATMAIVDNFRWDCKGCVPSEVDDCGIQQPQ